MRTLASWHVWAASFLAVVGATSPAGASWSVFPVESPIYNLHSLKRDPLDIAARDNQWRHATSGSPVNFSSVESALKEEMAAWNTIGNSRWEFDATSITRISTSPQDDRDSFHDVYWVNEPDATWLARAPLGSRSVDYWESGNDIYFNAAKLWSFSNPPPAGWTYFNAVASHELGHAMGLAHNDNDSMLMYPFYDPEVEEPQEEDKVAARYLYGGYVLTGRESGPPSMNVGDTYVLRYFVKRIGHAAQPADSDHYLDISVEGPASVSVHDHDPDWDEVTFHAAGDGIFRYDQTLMSAKHPLISGRVRSPSAGEYWIEVAVTPTATGEISIFYRSNYTASSQGFMGGYNCDPEGNCGWATGRRGYGGLDPRTSSHEDQQEFPAYLDSYPVPASYTLSVTKSGSGTVTSSPSGINCGSECSHTYSEGTVVSLTATPASGWSFSGWTGESDCSDGTVTMNTDRSCTANFSEDPPAQHQLTVGKSGSGTVTSNPAGIDCGADCDHSYTEGTVVSLNPSPAVGWSFSHWGGHSDCSDGTVTMNADRSCTANFSSDSCSDFTLLNQTISSTTSIEACANLYAGPGVAIVSPGDVTLQAGGKVILKDGFSVESNGKLTVISGESVPEPGGAGKVVLTGGSLNGQSLGSGSWSIVVSTNQSISGNVLAETTNIMGSGAVAPFGYTWTWGSRVSAMTTVSSNIPSGTESWNVSIDLTAPGTPGTYYLLFGFGGEFNMSQVLSCHNWNAGTVVWFDGNDYHDLSSADLETAADWGFVPDWSYRMSSGYVARDIPVLPIKVIVQ